MSKKSNIILSIIIVSFIASVCSIGVYQNNPSTHIKKQDDDILTELSAPKTSGYTVSQKWKWKNNFPGVQNVEQIEISLDGNNIIARWAGNNPNATLFKKDSNSTVWIYDCISGCLDVAISGDGKYIAVSNVSHVMLLNNSVESPKKELWKFPNYANIPNYYVDISLTGDYISAVNNTHVILLNKNGQVEWTYDTGASITTNVAISADGRHVIAGTDNNEVLMFNTTDYDQGIPMWTYDAGNNIEHVAISDNGNYAVASDAADEVFFFNTTDYDYGMQMWEWGAPMTFDGVQDLAISSDGKSIVVADSDSFLYFNHSFATGQKLPMWSYTPASLDAVKVDITADGEYVLGARFSLNSAYLFNKSITNPKLYEWSSGNDWVYDVAISGWGNYFAVGKADEEIVLYHHARPIPRILSGNGGGDDDDDEEAAIPFGNYYLVFAFTAIVALIIIIRRKAILIRNKL